jgi:radical SAM protein with 4Fe4S-binding SPASM domain
MMLQTSFTYSHKLRYAKLARAGSRTEFEFTKEKMEAKCPSCKALNICGKATCDTNVTRKKYRAEQLWED